jgi:flagellar biosynthesis/type III secretory pathway M-ring protein FliF/YscJ
MTMKDSKHNHDVREGSHSNNDEKSHRPFWKRVHRDWRSWVVAILMILAMIYYVMSDDFAMRFRGRSPQSQSGSVGK